MYFTPVFLKFCHLFVFGKINGEKLITFLLSSSFNMRKFIFEGYKPPKNIKFRNIKRHSTRKDLLNNLVSKTGAV